MNKVSKIIAVTIVTALFISLFCFPSYANTLVLDDYDYWNSSYFMPSPQFPNMESLPYGTDTLIYELMRYDWFNGSGGQRVNGYTVTRFFVKRDLYSGNGVSAFNGATFCFSGNSSNALDGFVLRLLLFIIRFILITLMMIPRMVIFLVISRRHLIIKQKMA